MKSARPGVLAIHVMLFYSYLMGSTPQESAPLPDQSKAQQAVEDSISTQPKLVQPRLVQHKKRKYLLQRKPQKIHEPKRHKAHYPQGTTFAAQKIGGVLKDAFILNVNLFSWDTFKILASTFPLFIGARMIDENIQMHFYDPVYHKNIRQMPKWCHDVAQKSIAAPIVLLGIQAFTAQNREMQQTSRMLLIGLPFVIWGKEIIKKARFDSCYRPWNQKFGCKKRAYGGFPSGHTAEAVYVAVLYGMRYGPKYAIPLGLLAGIIGTTFVTCNRHYISQVVGGAALGAMYGVAANRLIDEKLSKDLTLGMSFDRHGSPALELSYRF